MGSAGDKEMDFCFDGLYLTGEEAGNHVGETALCRRQSVVQQLTLALSPTPVPRRNGLLLDLWLSEVNSSRIHLVLLLSEADAFLWREIEVGRELYFIAGLEPASAMVQARKLRHRGCRELIQVSHLHTGHYFLAHHRAVDEAPSSLLSVHSPRPW